MASRPAHQAAEVKTAALEDLTQFLKHSPKETKQIKDEKGIYPTYGYFPFSCLQAGKELWG